MKIEIDVSKNAQQNALAYFEKSKKKRLKIKGAEIGITKVKEKLRKLEDRIFVQKPKIPQTKRKKEWFEKFRWCFTTNNLLVVGGRDAHSNEFLIKKHLEKDDLYFHADAYGAPHCILKHGQGAKKEDLEDAASFAGLFSSAWKKGFSSVKVYSVLPGQVSKKAPSGESLGRGAFMIYGKREWYDSELETGIGVQKVKNGLRAVCGPLPAVKKNALHVQEVVSGEKSKSDVAKSFLKFIMFKEPASSLSLDDIIAVLPNGKISLKP
jgi:predicted ribosome quality control (RQC) complex YloA/Tae2 family protein